MQEQWRVRFSEGAEVPDADETDLLLELATTLRAEAARKGVVDPPLLRVDAYEFGFERSRFRGTCLYLRDDYNPTDAARRSVPCPISSRLKRAFDLATEEGHSDLQYVSDGVRQALEACALETCSQDLIEFPVTCQCEVGPGERVRTLIKITILNDENWIRVPHHARLTVRGEPTGFAFSRFACRLAPYLVSVRLPSEAEVLGLTGSEPFRSSKVQGRAQFDYTMGLDREDFSQTAQGVEWIVRP